MFDLGLYTIVYGYHYNSTARTDVCIHIRTSLYYYNSIHIARQVWVCDITIPLYYTAVPKTIQGHALNYMTPYTDDRRYSINTTSRIISSFLSVVPLSSNLIANF